MNTQEIAAAALQLDGQRLALIAHNVANAGTTAYKRKVLTAAGFDAALAQAEGDASATARLDISPGKFNPTGRALDVALATGEFLLVKAEDGRLLLTRQGHLEVSSKGVLQAQGLPVQGLSGDLVVPTNAQSVRIDTTGQVWADDKSVGTLASYAPDSVTALKTVSGGLYALPEDITPTPAKPQPILVAHLEASNVQSFKEMQDLVLTLRHAESMSRVLQTSDELRSKAIQKFGEF